MMAASLRLVCDNLLRKFPEALINPLWDTPLLKGKWWRLMGLPWHDPSRRGQDFNEFEPIL